MQKSQKIENYAMPLFQFFSNPKIIHDKIILDFMSPSNVLLVLLQRDFVESLNARKINFVIFIFLRIWGSHWNFHFFEAFSDGIQFVHGDLILIHINEAIDISNFAWNTIWNAFVTIWKKKLSIRLELAFCNRIWLK